MTRRIDPDIRRARPRLRVLGVLAMIAFVGLGVRLADLTLLSAEAMVRDRPTSSGLVWTRRADIVDREGRLIATDYPKVSVFADPSEVLDADETATKLVTVLPHLDQKTLTKKLNGKGRFVWVQRHITDADQRAIMHFGLPGIRFRTEYHRIYPQRELTSHVVGYVGVENQGLAGIERSFDTRLMGEGQFQGPLQLTLDLAVQEVVRSELLASVKRFKAKGGSGLVVDAGSGAILASVSLPDFDPNNYQRVNKLRRFNRNVQGSYELGSLFKVLTAAMALDARAVDIDDSFDAFEPLKMGRHRIDDFHAKYRRLSVAEVIAFSSNIGAAKMAMALGTEKQRDYFDRFGLLQRHPIRLAEIGQPQLPAIWREINTVTAAYGHGIAVSPLQTIDAVAAAICSQPRQPAHLVAKVDPRLQRDAVVSSETAAKMRWLMWLVAAEGSGTNGQVPGYLIGGKTGSADKVGPEGYRKGKILASFVAAFPIEQPRYLVLVTLDEPVGDKETFGNAHGGWTSAPTVSKIISRIGPVLGLKPAAHDAERWFRDRLEVGEAYNGRLKVTEPSFAVKELGTWEKPEGERGCACGTCLSAPG